MSRSYSSATKRFVAALAISATLLPPGLTPAMAGIKWGGTGKHQTPLQAMAAAIDQVEKEIDGYGSVVIKQPDVWGEARWTKHRDDYERILSKELDQFKFTFNAKIRESDTAFFMNATALSSAVNGGATPASANVQQIFVEDPKTGFPQPKFIEANGGAKFTNTRGDEFKGVALEPTEFLDQLSRYVDHLNQLRRINEGDDTADAPGYALNLMRMPVSILPGDKTRQGYGAEVTMTLTPELTEDLLPTTFKDLVINDLIDQLGLPLLKLSEQRPWKWRIDKETEEALRKEAKSLGAISDGLEQPTTRVKAFEDLKLQLEDRRQTLRINCFREDLTIKILTATGERSLTDLQIKIANSVKKIQDKNAEVQKFADLISSKKIDNAEALANKLFSLSNKHGITSVDLQAVNDNIDKLKNIEKTGREDLKQITDSAEQISKSTKELWEATKAATQTAENTKGAIQSVVEQVNQIVALANQGIAGELASSASLSTSIGSPRDRQARYAIAPTEIACVFGEDQLSYIAQDLDSIRESTGSERLHLPDVHGFLTEELEAAYRLVAAMEMNDGTTWKWETEAPKILHATRLLMYGGTERCDLKSLRDNFILMSRSAMQCQPLDMPPAPNVGQLPDSRSLQSGSYLELPPAVPPAEFSSVTPITYLHEATPAQSTPCESGKPDAASTRCRGETVRALAWAIVMESVLLNQQLIDDMKRVEKQKSTAILPHDQLFFFRTQPCPEECQVFNEYVRVRWPIHVFAIDPENQEQNVADSFARRRETQLALSLAFTSGRINAQNFSRFARRLDFELDTISLNRTVVGFSHGADTFGWRFFPRVQAPPAEGNLKTLTREMLLGAPNRDYDLKRRQLEPGIRELLAIVIMPSFVPQLRMDIRTNWFHLTKPKHKEFTTEDSVRIGEKIGYLRQCKAQCLTDGEFGRPGDSRRLLNAVDQLEKRLPLQDTLVKIPYENSRGGFQLFSEGTRNLGPELIGFYGEPGVNPDADTNLFLVGRHFNVNVTTLVIGGQKCEKTLLSRDVMEVKVPKGAMTMMIEERLDGMLVSREVVDAHVATPYGVSGHLMIPVYRGAAKAKAIEISSREVQGCIGYVNCAASTITLGNDVTINKLPSSSGTASLDGTVTALLSTGRELKLNPAKVADKPFRDIGKDLLALKLDELIQSSFAKAADDKTNVSLLQSDQPIALRVELKLTITEGTTKKETAFGPILIRLGLMTGHTSCTACSPTATPSAATSVLPQSLSGLEGLKHVDATTPILERSDYPLLRMTPVWQTEPATQSAAAFVPTPQ
ncbi:MAG: hypothetical protein C0478_15190 [Planctomyces sp.]|nr:hypothetical protein [Planctomyces sp.]